MKKVLLLLALAVPHPASADRIATVKSFDYGRTYVHTPERKELQIIAYLWKQRSSWTTIRVDGHGFIQDDEEASIELGQRRADRVRALLVKMGVDPAYVIAVGNSREAPGRYATLTVETCDHCRGASRNR